MSTSSDPDDERTVIRPPPVKAPAEPAPASSASAGGSDSGNALPVGTLLGEFELTGVVGEGGFGIVYLAHDRSLHRRVALKEYMPSALAQRSAQNAVSVKSERHRETFEMGLKSFVNEARLLAQFDHPSLVKVFRFWEANGTAFMAMPFYEGVTLKDKLRELDAPPDEAWLLALLDPLTEALAVIHAEQCYHRDIAPDNIILLSGSGRPLLLDFGAARRVIGDMTQALTVILKPGYAPLEQYAEVPSMKQGPWTDVYALAAVVYYAIMGRTPPPSVGRMMSDHYEPLVTAAAGRYSVRFLQAIDHALGVRPEERTGSIADLRAELGLGAPQIDAQITRPASFGDSQLMPAPAAPSVAAAVAARPAGIAAARPAQAAGHDARPRSRAGLWIGVGAAALVVAGVAAFLALAPAPGPTTEASGAPPAEAPAVAATAETAPAAPAAPPPAAPAPFSVLNEFDRAVQAQAPGFGVDAVPALERLRIGKDRLSFKVTSQRDGFVHVLVHGADGSLIQLLPNEAVRDTRIRAGRQLVLPPASWPLDTFEPAGREDFLVIVSEARRDFSALGATRDGLFLSLPTDERGAAAAREFAGPGSVYVGKVQCDAPGCDAYGAARFTVQIVH